MFSIPVIALISTSVTVIIIYGIYYLVGLIKKAKENENMREIMKDVKETSKIKNDVNAMSRDELNDELCKNAGN